MPQVEHIITVTWRDLCLFSREIIKESLVCTARRYKISFYQLITVSEEKPKADESLKVVAKQVLSNTAKSIVLKNNTTIRSYVEKDVESMQFFSADELIFTAVMGEQENQWDIVFSSSENEYLKRFIEKGECRKRCLHLLQEGRDKIRDNPPPNCLTLEWLAQKSLKGRGRGIKKLIPKAS